MGVGFPELDLRAMQDKLAEKRAEPGTLKFNEPLVEGLSGAQVWLMHYDAEDSGYRFTVLKVSDKPDDLQREQRGYETLKTGSLDEFLPQFQHLLDGVRADDPELPVILSCFATPRSLRCTPLGQLAEESDALAGETLRQLRSAYATALDSVEHRREREPYDHLDHMAPPDLLEKLRNPESWTAHGISPETPSVLLGRTLRPNAVHALCSRDAWVKQNFGVPHVPIHGDLNENNLLQVSPEDEEHERFVLIDFEKAHLGIPHYDLAFLFVRLLFSLALTRLPEDADPIKLAERLADTFTNDEARKRGLPVDLRRASMAVQELFHPLKGLQESKAYVRQWQETTGRMALAVASTALCFYELRNRTRNEAAGHLPEARRNAVAATFLYTLACCLLDDPKLIEQQQEHFTYPDLGQPAREVAPASDAPEAPATESDRAAALQLRVQRAQIKLVLIRSTNHAWAGTPPAGWRRMSKVGDFSYLSRCGADLPEYRRATNTCLSWQETEEGAVLPLVLQLDESALATREAELVLEGAPTARILSVDLIPSQEGAAAALGITLGVENCSVEEYLTLVAARVPGKLHFRWPKRPDDEGFTLAALERELFAALKDNRAPRRDGLTVLKKRFRASRTLTTQYLLSAPDQPWSDLTATPAFQLAWNLIVSRSPPHDPAYPKNPESIRHWTHPSAKGTTEYAWWTDGPAAWADGRDEFNTTTKPRIMLESLYLQWLVGNQLGPDLIDQAREVYHQIDREIRQKFFAECWSGRWKQPLRPTP